MTMAGREDACVLHAADVHSLLHCLSTIATRIDSVTLLAEPSADLSRALREMEGAERAMRHFLQGRLNRPSPTPSATDRGAGA
jgi:hypothetical protein